eukprot:Blabericola_migrator_1__8287@NODE_429_length_8570_cov_338_451135_g338_i0_p3_GENE_NODE_429_length_8570_cov_338_451135_g338_i0NODE_429_length_8570_cov_338_451135_g338_i0_p3_ORF_typecomplete_len342_score8_65YrhK/PF14145_6/7_9YrhK/PF14145_6/0_18YrhK/PF14145_6/2_5e08DUF872/PF05915_12/1_1e03DUF872/PF05915_12/1_7DUF872/PF05915_12/0_095DUF423/PF04241_15/7_4DUF423/PF04241_15/1_7e02DUF423/PF04241_15/7_8_NODE_429_length_8570_cov_338_451135_g338_i037154740
MQPTQMEKPQFSAFDVQTGGGSWKLREEEEVGLARRARSNVCQGKGGFWLKRAATRSDWHLLTRCILNLMGALGFLVGSVGWVANFLLAGTFIFAGANVFYITTGIWWALSTRKMLARRIRLSESHLQLLDLHAEDIGSVEDGLSIQPLGLIEQAIPNSIAVQELWPREEVTRAFTQVARIEVTAAVLQIVGGVGFNCGCFLSLKPTALLETNFFYLLGSVLFLGQAVIGQLMCGSFTGPLLPVWPRAHRMWTVVESVYDNFPGGCCGHRVCIHKLIPGALLNTLGSLLFSIGSYALFYEEYAWLGGWGYTYGSVCFVVAALADTNGLLDALAIRLLQKGS